MFTIRFVRPDKSYKSCAVVQYRVVQGAGSVNVAMSRTLDGDSEYLEHVGPEEEFEIAYITNINGRTIDVVRQKES